MKRRWIAAGVAGLIGLGIITWQALFFDPVDYARRASMASALAQAKTDTGDTDPRAPFRGLAKLHQGDGPCLRYADAPPAQRRAAARAFVDAGLGAAFGDLSPLFLHWALEQESAAHTKSEVEEQLDLALAQLSWHDRLLINLHRQRVVRGLEGQSDQTMANMAKEAEEKLTALDPTLQEKVRPLWEQHRAVLTFAGGLMDVLVHVKHLLTAQRLDRLEAKLSSKKKRTIRPFSP